MKNVDDYIKDIEGIIGNCPAIASYTLNIDRKTEDIAFLSGALEFRDGSLLDFKEFVEYNDTLEKFKYAYNYRSPSRLGFRFDNAPDPAARELLSFPHHKHLPDGTIVESCEIALSDVLSMIEEIILHILDDRPDSQKNYGN
ncbi:MAG: hypothetical protein COS57_01530 [Syntrophobacterales bacterium CG03_land_8_20_14_0_80_58_14]|nr:MAG: hypothetical protein COS57_01530 [Syntrophobacterales bacterium CG03_land_8_20_14_0_80_58_14]